MPATRNCRAHWQCSRDVRIAVRARRMLRGGRGGLRRDEDQEAEERLQQAIARLAESEKQLNQAQLVIDSIKTDANKNAQQVKSTILPDGKAEIERLTSAAKSQIGTVEARVRKQISDYVVALALQRITMQLEGKLNSNVQQQIIDRNISKLAE